MGVKLSQLFISHPADALTGAELFEVTQGGVTKAATANQIKAFASPGSSYLVFGETVEDFPATGVVGFIYMALDTGATYKWDSGLESYVGAPISGNSGVIPKFGSNGASIEASNLFDDGTIVKSFVPLAMWADENNYLLRLYSQGGGAEVSQLAYAPDLLNTPAIGFPGPLDFFVGHFRIYLDTYEVLFSEDDTTMHVGTITENLNLRTGSDSGKDNIKINGTPAASGTFTSQDGKTITVTKGIITGIV